jgi:Phosphoglycerol transferase and related proteins, alkaline phosphatase superfamily
MTKQTDLIPTLKRAARPILLKLIVSLLFLTKIFLVAYTLNYQYSYQLKSQIFGTLGALAVLTAFSFILSRQWRKIYLLTIDIGLSAIFLQDMLFFRHFQDIMTWRTAAIAWHYLFTETAVWTLLKPVDLLLIADFAVLLTIKSRTNTTLFPVRISSRRQLHLRGLALVIFLSCGLGLSFQARNILETDQPGITNTFYSKLYIAQSVGTIEFHALDLWRDKTISSGGQPWQTSDLSALTAWFQSTHPQEVTNSSFGIARGKNLITIQVESLQEFVIGKTINGQEITPNLNHLLGNSLYFKNYFGETWNGGTSDAEFLSNISLYPPAKGSAYIDYPMNHYTSIGNVLQKQGYRTAALEANKPGFWDMALMSRTEGFQELHDTNDFVHDEDIGISLADASLFTQSIPKLKKLPQPFYSFLITLSSHYPFKIPEKNQSLDVAPYQGTLFGDYLEAVHYTDQSIGEFVKSLQAKGLLDTSILTIYGDHPAPLDRTDPNLGRFLGYPNGTIDDFHWLALQKVPLLIHLPGDAIKGIQEVTGGQTDLFPTLLGLLGEKASQYPLLGHDLLHSPAAGLAISRNGMLVSGNRLYNIGAHQIYNLDNGQSLPWNTSDPAQQVYQQYLNNADTIMRYDLQEKLGKEVSTKGK